MAHIEHLMKLIFWSLMCQMPNIIAFNTFNTPDESALNVWWYCSTLPKDYINILFLLFSLITWSLISLFFSVSHLLSSLFSLLYNQWSSIMIINLWVSTNGAPRIIHLDHSSWSSIVIIIEAPLWSPIVDQIGREVEKHQATNGERDERGRLRVKTVWVKFWICLCIQICGNGFCSDVDSVFWSDGLLKITADDGFCVCFVVRHGLMSFVCVLQWGMYWWVCIWWVCIYGFFSSVSLAVVALGLAMGIGFGCGYGYGRGFFFFFVFSWWWWWVCDWCGGGDFWWWVDEKERKIERRRTEMKREER